MRMNYLKLNVCPKTFITRYRRNESHENIEIKDLPAWGKDLLFAPTIIVNDMEWLHVSQY